MGVAVVLATDPSHGLCHAGLCVSPQHAMCPTLSPHPGVCDGIVGIVIVVDLHADWCPLTAKNFLKLCN
jgi:hypothetical protein